MIEIEVEELAGGGDIPGDPQVERDQSDRRPVDNPAIAFNRRPGWTGSKPGDIDREVDHPGAFREVHG